MAQNLGVMYFVDVKGQLCVTDDVAVPVAQKEVRLTDNLARFASELDRRPETTLIDDWSGRPNRRNGLALSLLSLET